MKSLIFIQAPGEVANMLSIYEECLKDNDETTIVCLGLPPLYKFVSSLELKANVVYFEPITISLIKPYKWFSKRCVAKKNRHKIGFYYDKVFFATKFDLQLAAYSEIYFRHSRVTYQRCYDYAAISEESSDNIPLKQKLRTALLSVFTGAKLQTVMKQNRFHAVINLKKYPITVKEYQSDASLFKRYSLKLPMDKGRPIIFFAEPFQNNFQTEKEYNELNIRIVNELTAMGYTIYAKGHPRKGCHPAVEQMNVQIIPSYIPSEFIDLNCFLFAIDFFSTALCTASFSIPAYSVIDMYEIRDQKAYAYWVKYINESSNSKVIRLKDFKELSHLNNLK